MLLNGSNVCFTTDDGHGPSGREPGGKQASNRASAKYNNLVHQVADYRVGLLYASALITGSALYARLALIGELGGGIALVVGFKTRIVAALAALMILNFHLATGGLIAWDFLSDASGLVVVVALIALAIGGRKLPLSVKG
jgi:hypothetical protein